MPKNKKGGKGHKKGKNIPNVKKELVLREDCQEYGQVISMLGDMRVEVECLNEEGSLYKKRKCKIRGNMRKRCWINKGDIILIGLRDYEDDKADVIHKYDFDEVIRLKSLKEIPENLKFSDDIGEKENDVDGILFGYSSEDFDSDEINDI